MSPNRYYPLSVYFKRRFGHRVRKLPLDAGGSCPNRDGTISATGCIFCNDRGSGSGLAGAGLSLSEQYLTLRNRLLPRATDTRFLAYIQSFSNTYGPADRLRSLVRALAGLPDLAGLAIGTRPDCLDDEKLAVLADAPFDEIWLDLGLQSACDQTLQRINRGHDAACFSTWATRAGKMGLKVCAHVITGLPGETLADFEQTVSVVNSLPVSGIKIHNLYVCKGTALEGLWRAGEFEPHSREESMRWLVRGLSLLRQDIVVHRINGDPAPGELAAPLWAGDKSGYIETVRRLLSDADIWQGKALGLPLPDWFNQQEG